MISQVAPTPFSLTFSESTGAISSSESTRRLWKLFRWWFPSRQRHCFRWIFLSKQGLRALTNPHVTCGSGFFDYFLFDSALVFVDYFWIKRGCVLSRIQASPMEGVSLMILEAAST
jgi:hypothetical protein